MLAFQQQFIDLAVNANALRFGEFVLKSGRNSPYFFNAGQFNSGAALAQLGACYAAKIVDAQLDFDMLFGPAYKGIPLVAVTAAALAQNHGIDVPLAFNRKEAKTHGEGGSLVGAPLRGNVLIIDDVITAGTAIREVIALFGQTPDAKVSAVVIGLDRKEITTNGKSAVGALKDEYGIDVESIITIEHLMEYLSNNNKQTENAAFLESVQAYWQQYGTNS
jgi:orotate phosphoribosyltransferase